MSSIKVSATYKVLQGGRDYDESQAQNFWAKTEEFETAAEAEAAFAAFPKACKFKLITASQGWTMATETTPGFNTYCYYGQADAMLQSNGVNGGSNEAGIKRYRKVIASCAKLGVDVEWTTPWGNSFATQEAFEAVIA